MNHCILCYTQEASVNDSDSWVLDGLCHICKNMNQSSLVNNIIYLSGKLDEFNPDYVKDLQSLDGFEAVKQSREKYALGGGFLPYCKKEDKCLDWGDHEMDFICPACGLIKKSMTAILPEGGTPYHSLFIDAHNQSHIEDEWSETHARRTHDFRFYYGLKDWNSFNAITPCLFMEALQYYKRGEHRAACALFQECFIQSFFAHKGIRPGDDIEYFPRMYEDYAEHYAVYSLVLAARCAITSYVDVKQRCTALLKIADHWARNFKIKDLIIITTSELMNTYHPLIDIISDTWDKELRYWWVDESESFIAKSFYYWRKSRIDLKLGGEKSQDYVHSIKMLEDNLNDSRKYADSRKSITDDLDKVGPSFEFFNLEVVARIHNDLFIENSDEIGIRKMFFDTLMDLGNSPTIDWWQLVQLPLAIASRNWNEKDEKNVEIYSKAYFISQKKDWAYYMFVFARKLLMIRQEFPDTFADYIDYQKLKHECTSVGINNLEFD